MLRGKNNNLNCQAIKEGKNEKTTSVVDLGEPL
jgi:hypothetical protein